MASGGMIALPSLTLNYYAFVALIVLGSRCARPYFCPEEAASLRLDGARDLLPVAYLLAHVTLLGLTVTTYSLPA